MEEVVPSAPRSQAAKVRPYILTPKPSAVPRSEERADDQWFLHSFSPGEGGGSSRSLCSSCPRSRWRKTVEGSRGLAHSPVIEDVE